MRVIYGPVPSWRLGRSLGVDPLGGGAKRCTFDCLYCQLGPTPPGPVLRDTWVDTTALAEELQATRDLAVDHITFAGMGEPTLAANLGDLLRVARHVGGSPLAILTNASLLGDPEVRAAVRLADRLVVKLDAATEAGFLTMNRPRIPCSLAEILDGIRAVRDGYTGYLALQMMFIAENRAQAESMAALARSLAPDEVYLNTPLRPSPASPLPPAAMREIARAFEGLRIFQVYDAPRPAAVPLEVDATRRRRPEHWEARDRAAK
jgi:wyosine [tRNA(Phe)-imidazoG37] synthetase (radical SAM superfamily)